MPPKKNAADSESGGGNGKFVWEGPNDTKLLLLTQGRYVKPDEYEQLSSAFPGTTVGSIRNRISTLRIKQRQEYEKLGWTLPEGAAGPSVKKTSGKKRGNSEFETPETPMKTPRVKKAKKSMLEESVQEKEDGDEVVTPDVKGEPDDEV